MYNSISILYVIRVGSATNEIYRKDGRRVEMHPTEDRLFHFSVEEFGVSLYGVVDGFGGAGVADFGAKKMPAELLLGQVIQSSIMSQVSFKRMLDK